MFVIGIGFPDLVQGQIRTVQCHPVGDPEAEPVIELSGNQQLVFSFDDLSPEVNSYSYRIIHCDPDWNSSNLSPFAYLDGFLVNPMDRYAYSFNTSVPYTRFTLLLPNEETRMKISGNYLLQVYNDAFPDRAVLSQRFSVLERQVSVTAEVVNAADPRFLYTSQQLNFTVNYARLPIYHPQRDTRVYVTENQDPNSRRNFTPVFVRQDRLVYGNGLDNRFDGLSPFRCFQCSSLVYYTEYVKEIVKGPDGRHHVILQPGTVPQRYLPSSDRNGNFFVEAENVQHADLEADYIAAHFAVRCPEPVPDADVYVYGKFSGWQLLPEWKMAYDARNKAYVGEGMLKQGYYDYMYAVVPHGTESPDLVRLQNNFYQTPNDYQIRFYLYDYHLMCFRLVGYQTVKARL